MFMYVNVYPKLERQYTETWVFGMFLCWVRQGKYIWGLGNWAIIVRIKNVTRNTGGLLLIQHLRKIFSEIWIKI